VYVIFYFFIFLLYFFFLDLLKEIERRINCMRLEQEEQFRKKIEEEERNRFMLAELHRQWERERWVNEMK
jgi:hypothetical protein